MILTTSYRGHADIRRDLLAGFSSVDHHTSAALGEAETEQVFRRLLLRLAALCSLHGPETPSRMLELLPSAADPFAVVSHILDTGEVAEPSGRDQRRELQQELVHFSRIVDVGTVGFGLPAAAGTKRVRNSHRMPSSLKVLSELMVVARGRLLQRGRPVAPVARRRPGVLRTDLNGDATVHAPAHSADYMLIVVCSRRRLRLEVGFLFDSLLIYLPPVDAFAALTAYLAETTPHQTMRLWLLTAPEADQVRAQDWACEPDALPSDSFGAALALLPRRHDVTCASDQAVSTDIVTGQVNISYRHGVATVSVGDATGDRPGHTSVRLENPTVSDADASRLIDKALPMLSSAVPGSEVRSIECGHIHLDRSLDIDQEAGARVGAAAYEMFSTRQANPPLLAPMMDDDHVLVHLRPQQYADFLRQHFPTVPLNLIPESSPIIRAIAVALYNALTSGAQREQMTTRGRNLFLRLADGSFCELFEDIDDAPVSGCVLFEASLLVYRTDPSAFDNYVQDRFATTEHIHATAARILDGAATHDEKTNDIAQHYRLFEAITDPRHPDSEFADLVGRVLAAASGGVVHLNVLEDYYEVQQAKVRQLVVALGLPIRLVTLFFNTQTGRVAVDG